MFGITILIFSAVFLCSCSMSPAVAQQLLDDSEIQVYKKYSDDLGMPILSRIKRLSSNSPSESAVRMGAATEQMVAKITSLMTSFPQFVVQDRHYWPSDYSLTKRVGLQGINSFIGDVVYYERTKAMATAREASCRQRSNCLWNQRFATFGNLFGSLSEEQKLIRNVNCDSIFAGCLHFH